MCSIAGITSGEDQENVEKMLLAMKHRSPDDLGVL